jgi:hypothetical protein
MLGQVKLRKEVANRLEQARLAAGFASAENFCEQHSIPLETYLRHETGRTAIKASHAMQYSKLLNISLHWLMLGEERDKMADDATETKGKGVK